MRPLKPIWLAAVASVALFAAGHNTFSQVGRRDLRAYRRGPSIDLKNAILPAQTYREKAPVRQFLWELWSSRTKGFFDLTSYSREGAAAECRYFVEPVSGGRWGVLSECKPTVCPYTSRAACDRFLKAVQTNSYDLVERIKYSEAALIKAGPEPTYQPVPDNEKYSPLDFLLILKHTGTGKTERH